MIRSLQLTFLLLLPLTAKAATLGEEIDVTAGAVTGLACAIEAQKTGDLNLLTTCPLIESIHEIVIFDVAERAIYRLAKKKIARHELESAYGGGSIDFSGKALKLDKKSGIVTVEVAEYSITKKPKAGSFKGCL